jgi:anti-sigma B factor antagonist
MATPLSLTADLGADGTPRVAAAGEIDLSNINAFTDALETASAGTRGPITVDLSAVKYLDSAGVNALFDHADQVDDLHLIVHPLLIRVLTISGLTKIANAEAGATNANT